MLNALVITHQIVRENMCTTAFSFIIERGCDLCFNTFCHSRPESLFFQHRALGPLCQTNKQIRNAIHFGHAFCMHLNRSLSTKSGF